MDAIIYLLNNIEEDKQTFIDSMDLLGRNYLMDYPCDIILFHEANFDAEEKRKILSRYSFKIKFQEVLFKVPDYSEEIASQILEYFPHPEQIWKDRGHKGFPLGYRHMCRFFAGGFLEQECLKKYKYVWRLDTDSFILNRIRYNIFDRMRQNDAVYGYINIQHDHIGAVKGLWEAGEKYDPDNDVFKDKEKHFRRVFYSNFEVFNLDWFRGEEYTNFFEYIDSTGGIFINRWGDHVIRYLTLNMLGVRNRCLFFNDIRYQHGGIYDNTEIINTY